MTKAQELCQMSNEGALGRFLAEKFNGIRGHAPPREDADVLIVFENGPAPEATAINEALKEFYSSRGFGVKTFAKKDSVDATITTDNEYAMFLVTITTHYPWDKSRNSLRLSSYIFV